MNLLVKHYSGSISYGTNLPSSDVDFRGIYCDPPRGILTPWCNPRSEQWEDPSEEDTVITELYKYMVGYVNGSPNVLESLWVDEEFITDTSEAYQYLRDNREELLSKKLRYTFGGFAFGQLKRIKGHKKWINNPCPEQPPLRESYFKLIQNFLPTQVFPRDFNILAYNTGHVLVPYGGHIYGIVHYPQYSIFNGDGSIREVNYSKLPDSVKKAHPKFIVKLREEDFKSDLANHKAFWTWKRERNETRSALEEAYGYDCKHGMHIVRLLRMCEEVLRDGQINVKRPDAEELLAIRDGNWSYDQMLEWASAQDKLLTELFKTSSLPEEVDLDKARTILLTAEEIANEEKN